MKFACLIVQTITTVCLRQPGILYEPLDTEILEPKPVPFVFCTSRLTRDRLWGQNLSLHPHLHCIVPAAGITLAGNWKKIGGDGKYLHPVKLLSVNFRSHFMKCLKAWLIKQNLLAIYQKQIDLAWNKPWTVFCEPSMAKPGHVVKYLGNYTHRVAISNSRILNIDDKSVTFLHKDYSDNARQKPITMDGVEFLRRFCLHYLSRLNESGSCPKGL
jgi:hypothetical protein